jgi:hypothetical protein
MCLLVVRFFLIINLFISLFSYALKLRDWRHAL